MNSQLDLTNIRQVLTRLEETLIFGLIERAQYLQNLIIYQPGGLGPALGRESLLGFLLRECETAHAKVRRYTSPDEHPFHTDLPAPLLPPLDYSASPLAPNDINLNPRLRSLYETEVIPHLCAAGDDLQYGSSAVNDVTVLQTLSKRIHYGKFVAESKIRADGARFAPLLAARDEAGLWRAITDEAVEAAVLDRVVRKARAYGAELAAAQAGTVGRFTPDLIRTLYARWVIPLNKEVQVAYLLQRGTAGPQP